MPDNVLSGREGFLEAAKYSEARAAEHDAKAESLKASGASAEEVAHEIRAADASRAWAEISRETAAGGNNDFRGNWID